MMSLSLFSLEIKSSFEEDLLINESSFYFVTTTFSDLSDCIGVHVSEISGTDKGNFNLKWVHIAISNLKKHPQTSHMVSERKMQNYLEEFCYKLNRRYFGKKLFDRLIISSFILAGRIAGNHII